MLMRRHHHPESPDYYSSLAAASAGVTSPSLSLGIISSSLEKMPLELRLRRSDDLLRLAASGRRERAGALDEELSPKTECSEDSVEIRSTPMRIHQRKPQIILRPNAVLASPLHSSSLKRPSSSGSTYPPNKMSNWMDSEQPDEKRMRLMAGQQQQQPPPLTHFYHPASAQHQNVLKLAGQHQQQHQHPHELLLLEAERNRLFHHWMRPNNWPLPHVHPAAESSAAHHLMTSALHYHYPHLLQQQQQHHHQGHNYNLPPHPFLHPSSPASAAAAAASIFNLSYGHLLPHPIFHHQRPAAFFSTPPSGGIGKTLPPLSPICARSVTPPPPPPSILGPLPPLIPVGGSQSPRHIGQPPAPPPDFNHKKIPNASGESSSPSATSLTIGKKTNKKSAIHPAGRTSQATKESRKHPSDSGCDRKFSSKTADVVVAVKPPVLPLFLSVETLLSREKPAAPAEKIRPEERFRHAESEEEEEMEEEEMHWRSSSSAFRDGPDGFQPSAASGGASMAGSASHRNYKNMTRERRMQANARERTRVHTISSAFEALRRAVPSFSHGQRLSKLFILRVASAYIAALGQLAGDEDSTQESSAQIARDEEKDHQTTTTTTTTGRRQLAECVDRCTRTLMTEGQLLRRNRKRSGVANGRQPSDDEDD